MIVVVFLDVVLVLVNVVVLADVVVVVAVDVKMCWCKWGLCWLVLLLVL